MDNDLKEEREPEPEDFDHIVAYFLHDRSDEEYRKIVASLREFAQTAGTLSAIIALIVWIYRWDAWPIHLFFD